MSSGGAGGGAGAGNNGRALSPPEPWSPDGAERFIAVRLARFMLEDHGLLRSIQDASRVCQSDKDGAMAADAVRGVYLALARHVPKTVAGEDGVVGGSAKYRALSHVTVILFFQAVFMSTHATEIEMIAINTLATLSASPVIPPRQNLENADRALLRQHPHLVHVKSLLCRRPKYGDASAWG